MSAQAFFSSLVLASMNSSMSGCQSLRVFIFAARRVLPPLFTTLATWSYTFRKESGPLGLPPPESFSRVERRVERSEPVPLPILEEHRLAGRQPHDVLHGIIHALDEAGAALRVLVLCGGPLRVAGLAVVKIIALARALAYPVLVVQPDIEPDRGVERAVLVDAEPGEVVVKDRRVLLGGEIAVGLAPIGDGTGDAIHQLADGGFPAVLPGVGAVGDVAVKIFRDRDLRRQLAPGLRHFDVLLLEDHLSAVIGDFRGSPVPFDLIKRGEVFLRENPLEFQPFGGCLGARGCIGGQAGGSPVGPL